MSEVTFSTGKNVVVEPDLKGAGVWDIEIYGPDGEKVYRSWTGARTHHVIRRFRDELARWRPWYRFRRIRRRLFGRGIARSDFSVFNVSAPMQGDNGPTPFVLGEPHTLILEDDTGKTWEATIVLPEGTERASLVTANAGSTRRLIFSNG